MFKQEQPVECANQLVQEADCNSDEADRLRQEAILREMGIKKKEVYQEEEVCH